MFVRVGMCVWRPAQEIQFCPRESETAAVERIRFLANYLFRCMAKTQLLSRAIKVLIIRIMVYDLHVNQVPMPGSGLLYALVQIYAIMRLLEKRIFTHFGLHHRGENSMVYLDFQ